jgi:hypothetical protein
MCERQERTKRRKQKQEKERENLIKSLSLGFVCYVLYGFVVASIYLSIIAVLYCASLSSTHYCHYFRLTFKTWLRGIWSHFAFGVHWPVK